MLVNTPEHRALRKRVETYLDGEADPGLAVAVRRHLAACWACSVDAEWLVLTKSALGRTGTSRPSELLLTRTCG
ncbi:MAG: zf-HC2 domain-containing protein [Acidimicrobiales bacterium]